MLDKDTEEFLSSVSEPRFSTQDFLSLFCASLFTKGSMSFSRDNLLSFIELNKNKYSGLLEDIKLRSNGVFSYSDNLDDAYSILKWSNLLYTISPEEDSMIYIKDDIPYRQIIVLNIEFYYTMECFVDEFILFDKKNINRKVLS